ncbi:squalene epoxidase-domain-containing protein [Suillus subalutaceus]|uniref:squalene epoxidase-domain-containing protein n=1 Tax=Suillus subalutaceus TaxID=48586 RepID=UPI001B87288E|nr:squalene epoxidase-domain-containing protein [Suillus subalutaceus]KAG1845890.1 squalene epoxidase-domain-containing protein [Suillus subalutaceus]
MLSSSYDVLIVGAGVAGPALAYALATKTYAKRNAPLRIALLERSLSKPDRMVAELLQPGGVASLKKLGLESCLGDFGSTPLSGFYVMRGERVIRSSFPEGYEGRAFEHGEFIMALRNRARRAPNVDMIETTVTGLIENDDTHRVIGVRTSKADGQSESYFADLVVLADGSLSKFRTAVLGNMPYEPSQKGYLAGLIVKDLTLPAPRYATMIVLKGAGPVVLYELPNNEYRMLVELKAAPLDLKDHILRNVVPQLPLSVRAPILNALETSRLRRVPHYYLPPTKQGESSKAGAFLLGDSLNMRHPLTAGGMTVALNDVVILSDLLAHIENFGNWDEISAVLRKWTHMRKPLASTINTMSMSWAGLFSAEGEAFEILQDGAFQFIGQGPKYSEGPMALAAGITASPLLLAYNSLAIAFYSIWVLFTHPRPGNKFAPQFYEYPLLLVKALTVLWTIGNVMGPVLWAEM